MKNQDKKITPEFTGGTVVYSPETMIPRLQMFDAIRGVFSKFGYSPLETPILQKEVVLTGGDSDIRIFKIHEEVRTDSARALRFDLTVPFSVYLASNMGNIKLPFKRSEIGPVFRPETAQKGRYNQFYQCDIDIAGAESGIADAEIVAVMVSTLKALNVFDFTIKINNRKILNALPDFVGFDSLLVPDVLRILDKMDKIGMDGVKNELISNEKTLFSVKQCDIIEKFLNIKDLPANTILDKVEQLIGSSEVGKQGICELREILACLPSFGINEEYFVVDLSIARGLGYYTGIVFETTLNKLPSIGSVFSGGRYDDLVDKFGSHIPAVGASVGIDRLFTALDLLGLIVKRKNTIQILVLDIYSEAKLRIVQIATALRESGLSVDIYMGKESRLGGQIGYASNLSIPYVVFIGENEFNNKTAIIKNMVAKTQIEVSIETVAEKVLEMM